MLKQPSLRNAWSEDPPRLHQRLLTAGYPGLSAISYGYIAAGNVTKWHGMWMHAVVPSLLTMAFLALLAVQDGRLCPSAIQDRESLLVISFAVILTSLVQITWLSQQGSGVFLLVAALPALVCWWGGRLCRAQREGSRRRRWSK